MPRRSGISAGTVVVIAMVTSVVTSVATFFVVREWTGAGSSASTAEAPYFPPNTEAKPAAPQQPQPAEPAAVEPPAEPAPAEPPAEPAPPAESNESAAAQVVVPALEGVKVDKALLTLMKLRLRVANTERRANRKIGKGRVISSDPAAGTLVAADTQVSLVVSEGSPDVEVPSVAGKRLASARREIEKAGLRARLRFSYDEDVAEGVVLSQSPRQGTRVAPGSTVRIRINRSDY